MSRRRSREVMGKEDFRLLLDAALTSDEMLRGISYGVSFAELRAPDIWTHPDIDGLEAPPRYTDVSGQFSHWEYAFGNAIAFAQSPIEKKALVAFLLLAQVRRYLVYVTEPYPDFLGRTADLRSVEVGEEGDPVEYGMYVTPQAGIPSLGIRVDAVLWRWGNGCKPLVVEFDGYAWHKGNFTSDRQRDRDLQLLGFDVVRFSGAEINADPLAIAVQLDDLVRRNLKFKGAGE